MTDTEIRSLASAFVTEFAELARLGKPRPGTHRFVIDISEAGSLECRYFTPSGYITTYFEPVLPVDPDALSNLVQSKLATGTEPWYLDTGMSPGGPMITVVRRF